MPTYTQWRSEAEPPRDIYLEMGRHGFLAAMVGPPFPIEYVDPGHYSHFPALSSRHSCVSGTPVPEDFDYFHEMILYDEISRCGNAAGKRRCAREPKVPHHSPHVTRDVLRSECGLDQRPRHRDKRTLALRRQETQGAFDVNTAANDKHNSPSALQATCTPPPPPPHAADVSQDKYLKDVLMGRSFCALAISEPGAGSDVAGAARVSSRALPSRACVT